MMEYLLRDNHKALQPLRQPFHLTKSVPKEQLYYKFSKILPGIKGSGKLPFHQTLLSLV